MTLADAGEFLAERAGRQLDVPFKLQMEDAVLVYRARYLANSIAKNPAIAKFYMQSFKVQLEPVNKDECAELSDCGCENVLRSIDEVPEAIRVGVFPFNYVGSLGGVQSYGWTTFSSEKYLQASPMTGKLPRYTYINRKIYAFNEKNHEWARVEGVWDDPRLLSKFTCPDSSEPCFSATRELPLDNQTLQLVLRDIQVEVLRLQAPEEKTEIKADKNV